MTTDSKESLSASEAPEQDSFLAGLNLIWRQVKALLYKNFLIKRRMFCQTLCEFLTPLIFVILILFGFNLSMPTDVLPRIYANETLPVFQQVFDQVQNGFTPQFFANNFPTVGDYLVRTPDPRPTSCIPLSNAFCFEIQDYVANNNFNVTQILQQLNVTIDTATLVRSTLGYLGPVPVFSFDLYTFSSQAVQFLTRDVSRTLLRSLSLFDNRYGNLLNRGVLIITPRNAVTDRIVAEMARQSINFNSYYLNDSKILTEQDAIDYALTPLSDKINRTWAVLNFNSVDMATMKFDYSIRMNYTIVPSTKQLRARLVGSIDTQFQKYYLSGFMSIQNLVDTSIFSLLNQSLNFNKSQDRVTISVANTTFSTLFFSPLSYTSTPFPTPSINTNPFYTLVGPLLGMFLVMSMLYPVSRLIKGLVEEKESKMRETMKIMGLKNLSLYISWMLTYLLTFSIIAVLFGVLLKRLFPNQSLPVLLILFLAFFWSLITLSFMISVFFNRSKLAAIIGPILLFASLMPYFVFYSTDTAPNEFVAYKTLSCVISPSAFLFAINLLLEYESANLPLIISEDPLSYLTIVNMIVLDIFIYAFLAWFVEQVLPNEYGTKRPFLFLCSRDYWYPQRMEENQFAKCDRGDNEADIEQVLAEPTIQIRGLRKEYIIDSSSTVTALHGMTLDIYKSQITACLGHNGAGKTTLLSVLTGLIESTDGDAFINGKSIKHDMDTIRQTYGICPQHDVLFSLLTVEEHLHFFASLRAWPYSTIDEHISQMIAEVGLKEKRDVFSMDLSGGQKRKLSISLAFIGGSKVVFLDEPTSGMDPYSRRSTWSLLRKFTEGRTIILTTHFLDEAELLSDRVAIMSEGHLSCCGSNLYLKSRYGLGYTLTISKAALSSVELSTLVASYIPQYSLLSHAGTELAFQLPLNSVSVFASLFERLEQDIGTGIQNYSISMTTLEDVFLRMNAGLISSNKESENIEAKFSETGSPIESNLNQVNAGFESPLMRKELILSMKSVGSSIFTQFIQLVYKRYTCGKRDIKGRIFEVVLPIIVVALIMLILTLDIFPAGPRLVLSPENLFAKPTVLPYGSIAAGQVENKGLVNWIGADPSKLKLIETPYTNSLDMSLYLLETAKTAGNSRWGAFNVQNITSPSLFFNGSFFSNLLQNITLPGNFTGINITLPDLAFSIDPTSSSVSLLHNTTSWHGLPAFVSYFTQSRLRNLAFSSTSVGATNLPTISVSNFPLPLTQLRSLQLRSFLALFAALFVMVPFCYLPASYSIFVVRERSVKSKHLQLCAGVRPWVYWVSTYFYDMVNYLFVCAGVMIIFALYNSPSFVGNFETSTATFLLFLLYGLACIPLSYVYSFAFDNFSSSQIGIAGIHFTSGFVLVFVYSILSRTPDYVDINLKLREYYRLQPPFVLGESMINLVTLDLVNLLGGKSGTPFEWDVLGKLFVYLLVESVVYFALTLMLEYSLFSTVAKYLQSKAVSILMYLGICVQFHDVNIETANQVIQVQPVPKLERNDPTDEAAELEDSDVLVEKASSLSVDISSSPNKPAVLIQHLRKVYGLGLFSNIWNFFAGSSSLVVKQKIAVKDLCLTIPPGQAFGLLGINGAGKSTTLNILTGDVIPTSGQAYINGKNVVTDLNNVRQDIGFCPQWDPLLIEMTAVETLSFFAYLRGIPSDTIPTLVEALIEKIGLVDFADKPCGGYSGGNKRKLSLGIALIGNPSVIFLDEPSTGMDPKARRFMWNLIQDIAKSRCVILTTHSMAECEATCSRLCIMVSGRLTCIGSSQHLKSVYGEGYQIELKSEIGHEETARDFILASVPGSILDEWHGSHFKFKIPRASLTLSSLFSLLESNKSTYHIEEYGVSQSSLEQIFVRLAKMQHEEVSEE